MNFIKDYAMNRNQMNLYYSCKKEKIIKNEKMHFIYFEIGKDKAQFEPTINGEWFWTKDIKRIKSLLLNVTLVNIIIKLFNVEYDFEDVDNVFNLLVDIEKNNPEIIKKKSFLELKNTIADFVILDIDFRAGDLNDFLEKFTTLFSSLGGNYKLKYFDCFGKAYEYVEELYDGVFLKYNFYKNFIEDEEEL